MHPSSKHHCCNASNSGYMVQCVMPTVVHMVKKPPLGGGKPL